MATTSLWRVSSGRKLYDVIDYAINPEKTEIGNVLEYVKKYSKTTGEEPEVGGDRRKYVSGINCSAGISATGEMNAVKERFGKTDGTVAYHGYQSFSGWECSPEVAHEIGVELAARLWGDSYQVVVATHLDKANHIHNHFVINTVSFVDGIKFRRTPQDYKLMRETSDELCREYGLSVIEELPERKKKAKEAIDEAIDKSTSLEQFKYELSIKGYSVELSPKRTYWTIKGDDWGRSMRMYRLGDDYTNQRIEERLALSPEERLSNRDKELSKEPVPHGGKRIARSRSAKEAIDEAIRLTDTLDGFAEALRLMGYSVDLNPNRVHWTIQGEDWGQRMRIDRLGDEYTNERISARLTAPIKESVSDKPANAKAKRPYTAHRRRATVRGSTKRSRKVKGFRALYYRYCYLLGIFPKKNPRRKQPKHWALKQDLNRLDAISDEAKLLSRHHIETEDELDRYAAAALYKIQLLMERRCELMCTERAPDASSGKRHSRLQEELSLTSDEIKKLKREVKLCRDIKKRTSTLKEKLRTVISDEKEQQDKQREKGIKEL